MPVAPTTSRQAVPPLLQRCHWRVNVGVGTPVQVPSDSFSVEPWSVEPEIDGRTVFTGAELGDVTRFQRVDQAVAYVGLDLQVRQSGKWQGQVKLSKRGSGRVRRVLYLAALRSICLPACLPRPSEPTTNAWWLAASRGARP